MELLPNTASGGGRPPAGGGRNRWPKPRTHSRPPAWPPHAIHGNPGQALARLPQHHIATVARAAKASPSTEAGLQPGDLVEFERDNKAVLGLVTQADGKAKHFVMDQTGRRVSISPRQVLFKLPGHGWKPSDLDCFHQAVADINQPAAAAGPPGRPELHPGTAPSHPASAAGQQQQQQQQQQQLAEAWELVVADSINSLGLADLTGLVLSDESPVNLYRMFKLLAADKLYFKQVPSSKASHAGALPVFEPRTPDTVQQLLKQAEEAAVAAADRAAWAAAARQALSSRSRAGQPSAEEWEASPHGARIRALKALAIKGSSACPTASLVLAMETLQLAGIRPPPASAPSHSASPAHTPHSPPGLPGVGALADAAASLLVDLRAFRLHEPLAALRRGVQLGFNSQLEQMAQVLAASPPPDPHATTRLDLTHLRCITIDDQSTTEVDDGLSVQLIDTDGPLGLEGPLPGLSAVRFWVHVADPDRWLRPGWPGVEQLLESARSRGGRSLYFPWGNAPMFPRCLSEGPFSLRQHKEVEVLSFGAVLRSDGSLADLCVSPARVRVTHKLTYQQADQLLATAQGASPPAAATFHQTTTDTTAAANGSSSSGGAGGGNDGSEQQCAGMQRELQLLAAAALLRKRWRQDNGCIDITLPEAKVSVDWQDLDARQPAVSIRRISQHESASRSLVAEMMILAGQVAGGVGTAAGLPLPYRGQPQPQVPLQEEGETGVSSPGHAYALRRQMTRSTLASTPHRHASLGLDAYVQVTSPIRRLPDLMAHANLKALALDAPAPYGAASVQALVQAASSEAMRQLGQAERAEEKYWVAEYFRQHLRADCGRDWPAVFLGWLRKELQLAALLIDELGLEVAVRVDSEHLQPGDGVVLGVLAADPVAGTVRFAVHGYLEGAAEPSQGHEQGAEQETWAGQAAAGEQQAAAGGTA